MVEKKHKRERERQRETERETQRQRQRDRDKPGFPCTLTSTLSTYPMLTLFTLFFIPNNQNLKSKETK